MKGCILKRTFNLTKYKSQNLSIKLTKDYNLSPYCTVYADYNLYQQFVSFRLIYLCDRGIYYTLFIHMLIHISVPSYSLAVPLH